MIRVGVALALLGWAAHAHGAPTVYRDELTKSQVGRPLTLPRNVLRVDLAPPDLATLDGGLISDSVPRGVRVGRLSELSDDVLFSIGTGIAFGLVRNVELGAHFFPILIEPAGEYGDIELYGRYRLVDQPKFELGAQLKLNLPVLGVFGAAVDLPAVFRLGDAVRLESGVQLEVLATEDTRGEGQPTLGLHLPLALTTNLTPALWTGLQTGVYSQLTGPTERAFVRLGTVLGYTFGKYRQEPVADVMAIFRFPRLFDSLAEDGVRPEVFDVVVGGRFYFRLRD
ncbi:MAG TPA: hypothetical protein RMG48_16625 [Myxococcales bacterium LLY-WYZ-16_1]|nr:hypothetical protein [Myxococcales bacterium LLY-WYZ-16_1]